ncbi:Gfo/Idh/MocA family protein [Aureibacillus halotolerans]|uniref:Putative dehydrogenase n=1 Tax=Aureibacillus halotolerans TaxID=1508390 RepID=A0A4R6TV49_9BACI|nr:Gfo/Idh/MocA family oxidoreductase [Aureibacillus halotolerans]TDQ36113.1 putative dehydrogenase [Aureibacillus halotolerans]
MLRFGIMSTAAVALDSVVPAIQRTDIAEVRAIASESGKAEEVAHQFEIPVAYDRYEALLEDPDIDAVYIPLPNVLHAEWAIKAAKASKHVLVEKPAALSASQARDIAAACEASNVVVQEAFMYRWHPQMARMKQLITSGDIGDVTHIRSSFSVDLQRDTENIRLQQKLAGGTLYDLGCYSLHIVRELTGHEPKEVYMAGVFEDGVDIQTTGILTLEGGMQAGVFSSFNHPLSNHCMVIGTKGSIISNNVFRADIQGGQALIALHDKDGNRTEETIFGDQYGLQIEAFARTIETREDASMKRVDLVNQAMALEACRTSLETNMPVALSF